MTDFANFIAWALIVMTPLMGAAALTMREIFIGDGAWIMAGALCAVAVAILLYAAVLIARRSAAAKEHIVIWLD